MTYKASRDKLTRFNKRSLSYGEKLSLMRNLIKGYEKQETYKQNLTEYLQDKIYETVQLQSLDSYKPVCISAVYTNIGTPVNTNYVYQFYLSVPEHVSHTKHYQPDWFQKVYQTDRELEYKTVMNILSFIYEIWASDNQ